MTEHVQHIREVRTPERTTRVIESDSRPAGRAIASRIVWYIGGVLLVLLGFRFILALLGANPLNGFADFVYTTSHPFVEPFFSLFNYRVQYGASRFEEYTLIAILVYGLIVFGIAKLFDIEKPTVE